MIIVECKQEGQSSKNTGAKDQCLEGVTTRHALATIDQSFASIADLKDLSKWKADRDLKKIIPLYQIEELAVADTEDTYFEGNGKYLTKSGNKIRTFNMFLGLCSHAAMASYNGKTMRVYEFTDAQEILAVNADATTFKGQLVRITVGKRVSAMPDKPAYTPVQYEYVDYKEFEQNGVIVKPTWSAVELDGIYDVYIEQVSASATSVKFTVDAGCAGDQVRSLLDSDLTFRKPDGTPITHTFVPADANGVYEFVGTGFVTGDLVATNGVVTQTEASYEGAAALAITI